MRFKRLSAWLLLVLLSVQSVGFIAYFHLEKRVIHKAIKLKLKQGVPTDELVHFQFTLAQVKQLNWKKSNEFVLGEQFFDVVWRTDNKDGKVHLACVNDTQETALFREMHRYIAKNLADPDSKNPVGSVFKIVQTPFVLHSPTWIFHSVDFPSSPARSHFGQSNFYSDTHFQQVFHPPIG